VSVTLRCATAGATIRYTLDGSIPTSSSPVYIETLTLTRSTTLKAKAMKTGFTSSAVASASFTIHR
jgi:hypothetical protein